MLGVEVAIVTVTCAAAVIMLLTAPVWMRGLTAIVSAIWKQLVSTDAQVIPPDAHQDIVDGEYREVDK